MKAAALAILDEADREADPGKVNALEASPGLGPELIPETWTPEHVGKRIVEAFETLARLPRDRGPKIPGNAWPDHVYDWEDQLAQASLTFAEQRDRQRSRNRPTIRANAEDLRRLDIVLEWMLELHAAEPNLCRAVQTWARLRAAKRSIKEMCRITGGSFQAFYRLRDKGVAIVVARLAGAPVW